MNIYVATAFPRYEEARAIIDAIASADHAITFDWTRTDEFENGHPKPGDLTNEQRRRYAAQDKQGVADCDLLFLLDGKGLRGAYMEFGMACAWGKLCYVAEPYGNHIFYQLPNVAVFDTREEALHNLGVN